MDRSFKTYLIEARRNSEHEYQRKLYGQDIFNKYKNLPQSELKNLFVSFTDVNKIGINPRSAYNTPIGIYTYPLDYVLSHESNSDLPFAGVRKHIFVVSRMKPILYLSTYDNLVEDCNKIKTYLLSKDFNEHDVDDTIKEALESVRGSQNIQASKMWNIARMAAVLIDRESVNVRRDLRGMNMGTDVVEFNKILRVVLGYDVIYDDKGYGIIHVNEPTQCVFLSKSALNVVEGLNNSKRSPEFIYNKAQIDQFMRDDNMLIFNFGINQMELYDMSKSDNLLDGVEKISISGNKKSYKELSRWDSRLALASIFSRYGWSRRNVEKIYNKLGQQRFYNFMHYIIEFVNDTDLQHRSVDRRKYEPIIAVIGKQNFDIIYSNVMNEIEKKNKS